MSEEEKAIKWLENNTKNYKLKSEELHYILVLFNLIANLQEKNQKYKEEKRLILKDIKKWINCAKNEKLEGDYIHDQYWDMFETILRKTFQKYNSENLSDEDLKYKHYLERENNELILENKKYKEVINKLKTNLDSSINAINKKLSNNKFRVENGKAIYPINDYCVVRFKGIRTKCKELLKILEEVKTHD